MPPAPRPASAEGREPRYLAWALAMPAATLGAFFLARRCLPPAASPLLAAALPALAAVAAAQAVLGLFAACHWRQLAPTAGATARPSPAAPGSLPAAGQDRSESEPEGRAPTGPGAAGREPPPAEPVSER